MYVTVHLKHNYMVYSVSHAVPLHLAPHSFQTGLCCKWPGTLIAVHFLSIQNEGWFRCEAWKLSAYSGGENGINSRETDMKHG